MSEPRPLTRRLPKALSEELRLLLPGRFFDDAETLLVYESDALTQFKKMPLGVALPISTNETAAVMKACYAAAVAVTPRGAGTGLSGGATPAEEGSLVVDTSAMKNLIEINALDRYAVVQPGLVNLRLTEAVQSHGCFYAPDPSSQMACTLGGNIAANSGGPHTLKYGSTVGHVLGLTIVLETGEVLVIGGPEGRAPESALDLVGAFVGSEGTLGIVTEAVLRLVSDPAKIATLLGAFADLPQACRAVAEMVAQGIDAAAIEAIDQLTIAAVEASVFAAGYPTNAGAVILVELDGHPSDVDFDCDRVEALFQSFGALTCERASDPAHRKKLWQGRKGAFGAMGRVAPDLYVMDCVVPRSKLEEAIVAISKVCADFELKLANVFHAGEGNLHPNISYDGRDADEVKKVLKAAHGIVKICLELGGTLSGEHGVGVEKREFMPLVFNTETLASFASFRRAFSTRGLMNPGKLLPTPRACTEISGDMVRIHRRVMEGR